MSENLPPVPRDIGVITGNGVVISPIFRRFMDRFRNNFNVVEQKVPVGVIASTLSATAPAGWLKLDGSFVSKSSYPDLFAIIGVTFGESGGNFKLPDMTGQTMIGAGSIALGAFGGSNSLTLTVGQLPAHSHGVTDPGHTHTFTGSPHSHTVTDPGHTHTVTDGGHSHTSANQTATGTAGTDNVGATDGSTSTDTTGVSVNSATTGVSVDNAMAGGSNSSETTGVTVNSTGSGDAIDTTPAALGINWIVKA